MVKWVMILPSLDLENSLWSEGAEWVAGMDEVGRGPLAGPVVIGILAMRKGEGVLEGVRDSKTTSQKQREKLHEAIKSSHIFHAIGEASNDEIDSMGLAEAINVAMGRAVSNLTNLMRKSPDVLLIDGKNVRDIEGFRCIKMDRGDSLHYTISAASIIAKVYRDGLMIEYGGEFPEYGFEKHMGYGTKVHLDAIKQFGVTRIHRKSFAPVSKYLL